MPRTESRKARRPAPGVAALALASALAVAAPAPAFAEANPEHQHFRDTLEFGITACEGEVVNVTGTILFNRNTFTDAAGQQHVTETTIATGVGEGSEGNTYSYSRESHTTQMFDTGLVPNIFTQTHAFRFIPREGSGTSFVLEATLHFTINANGDLIVVVSDTSSECR
jgi:hypothetical protein